MRTLIFVNCALKQNVCRLFLPRKYRNLLTIKKWGVPLLNVLNSRILGTIFVFYQVYTGCLMKLVVTRLTFNIRDKEPDNGYSSANSYVY